MPPGTTPPTIISAPTLETSQGGKTTPQKYDVRITDDDKVTQFVACIYKADILEDSVMEKLEEVSTETGPTQ